MSEDLTSPRLRRNRAVALTVKIVAVGIVLVVFAAVLVVQSVAIGNLTDQQRKADCGRQLLAYTLQDVAHAFNAPPSPNTARSAAVKDIVRSSDRYANAAKVCSADPTPAPLPPTPVTATKGATP